MSNRKEGRDGDEDGGLVAACQKGDGDAFGLLVQKYQKRAFNIAYRMTGDYEEAADVVQEAFLSAYRSIRSFRGDAKFSTWLYRICVNHAKSRLGQVKGRALHEGPSLDDGERTGGPAGAGARADEPGADERLAQRELQEAVQRAIARLEADTGWCSCCGIWRVSPTTR
jgi:RNA polymerase sigma-70 factor (ECF subfamily)